MKIVKGDKFLCTRDVFSDSGISYSRGVIYVSDNDGCITDRQCNDMHAWDDEELFREHFRLLEGGSYSDDKVNHPPHYTWLKDKCGIEVIDIVRHLDFDIGNALKYLLRAGHKSEKGYSSAQKQIEDLNKAIWYITDKIEMLRKL